MAESALIGRQPILRNGEELCGYELLFRDAASLSAAAVTDDRYATARVLADALGSFGLDGLVGEHKAFVNVDRAFLMDPVIETIPPGRFVLEVMETVEVDDALVGRVSALREAGYRFAIDDMDLTKSQFANFEPLLPFVSIVKVDLRAVGGTGGMEKRLELFAGRDLELLAEKVENREEYEQCKALGFSYFQGYFFAKPAIVSGKKLDPSKTGLLNLIGLLQREGSNEEIEREFAKNPELSINLLRYINSASVGTKKEISSIPHSIRMLGRGALSRWATLFLYAGSKGEKSGHPLLETAMLRGELMTLLAYHFNAERKMADKAYLVGLVSLMDVLVRTPLEKLFAEIPFDREIEGAVLRREGALGKLLAMVSIVERGNYDKTQALLEKIGMSPDRLSSVLYQAYQSVNGYVQR